MLQIISNKWIGLSFRQKTIIVQTKTAKHRASYLIIFVVKPDTKYDPWSECAPVVTVVKSLTG